MPIEFHCIHCEKLIRTGEEHAGRRGKCPYCHQSVYIPTPRDQIEPLSLSPLDVNEERERERLLKETRDLTNRILSEREKADAASRAAGSGSTPGAASHPQSGAAQHRPPAGAPQKTPAAAAAPKSGLDTLIVDYAICMADGDIDEAKTIAAEIRKDPAAAQRAVERLMMDQLLPTQLNRIPRAVLNGYLKRLLAD